MEIFQRGGTFKAKFLVARRLVSPSQGASHPLIVCHKRGASGSTEEFFWTYCAIQSETARLTVQSNQRQRADNEIKFGQSDFQNQRFEPDAKRMWKVPLTPEKDGVEESPRSKNVWKTRKMWKMRRARRGKRGQQHAEHQEYETDWLNPPPPQKHYIHRSILG